MTRTKLTSAIPVLRRLIQMCGEHSKTWVRCYLDTTSSQNSKMFHLIRWLDWIFKIIQCHAIAIISGWSHGLESLSDKTVNPMGLLCKTPEWLENRNVVELNDTHFCGSQSTRSEPSHTGAHLAEAESSKITISLIGGIVLLIFVVVLLLELLRTFRFKLYKYTKIHPFDRDECHGEDMDFDVVRDLLK